MANDAVTHFLCKHLTGQTGASCRYTSIDCVECAIAGGHHLESCQFDIQSNTAQVPFLWAQGYVLEVTGPQGNFYRSLNGKEAMEMISYKVPIKDLPEETGIGGKDAKALAITGILLLL